MGKPKPTGTSHGCSSAQLESQLAETGPKSGSVESTQLSPFSTDELNALVKEGVTRNKKLEPLTGRYRVGLMCKRCLREGCPKHGTNAGLDEAPCGFKNRIELQAQT